MQTKKEYIDLYLVYSDDVYDDTKLIFPIIYQDKYQASRVIKDGDGSYKMVTVGVPIDVVVPDEVIEAKEIDNE